MNDVFSQDEPVAAGKAEHVRDWRKAMSDHVAYALLIYTGLQILATMSAMKETGMKQLALVALVVLVAAIIPACRWFEKRWAGLTDAQAADVAYGEAFRRDVIGLWVLAIGLPFLLTGICKGIAVLL